MSLEILTASFSDISLGADISPTEIMRAVSLAFLSAIALPNMPECLGMLTRLTKTELSLTDVVDCVIFGVYQDICSILKYLQLY